MKWTTPPVVFFPNRVPCGPFNTSTLSRSSRSLLATRPERLTYTPSIKVPTVGSNPMLKTEDPNPRMAKAAPWLGGSIPLISSAGTVARRSKTSCTIFADRFSPLMAVIEIGTSWMDCSRFWAVTTTSSSTAWAPDKVETSMRRKPDMTNKYFLSTRTPVETRPHNLF